MTKTAPPNDRELAFGGLLIALFIAAPWWLQLLAVAFFMWCGDSSFVITIADD